MLFEKRFFSSRFIALYDELPSDNCALTSPSELIGPGLSTVPAMAASKIALVTAPPVRAEGKEVVRPRRAEEVGGDRVDDPLARRVIHGDQARNYDRIKCVAGDQAEPACR